MENMTSLELKAMAKELGVKNWWNLKKVELIAEIQKIQDAQKAAVEADDKNIVDESSNESESTQVESESVNEESIADESAEAPEKPSNKKQDLIEYNGKTQSLSAWARELNMPGQTLYARLHISNWPVEKAFTTPSRRKKTEEEA